MPRKKEYISVIEKFYRNSFEDTGMFFWVEGQRRLVPAVTIEESIFLYFKYLCIEDFNIESAISTYSRMKKELYASAKEN